MSQQIPTHYAIQFASNVQLLVQQKDSRLSGYVQNMPISGAKAATPVEQIGATAAKKRTTRYPPMVPADTPHARPWVYPSDYDWDDLIDSIDKLRMVINPQSAYTQSAMAAMNRAKDDEIIAAFFGDRKTDETGSTTTTFASEGSTVAVDWAAAGAVGMTVAKLREAKRILMANDVDMDTEKFVLGVTAKQHDNLLAEIQVISLDFNDKPVMTEGRITRFLGFDFRHTERFKTDANAYRRNPAYVTSGMCLATWNEISTDISIRRDLAGLPIQIYVYGTFGATRLEGKKVVEIKCSEA